MHQVTYMHVYMYITHANVCIQLCGYTLESKNSFLKQRMSLGSLSLFTACNSMLTVMDADGFAPQERELL